MSSTHRAFLPPHSARARDAASAHTPARPGRALPPPPRASRGRPLPTRRNTSTAPSQSVGAAGRTARPQISPRVSTSRCRLRPATFFPPVVPLRAAGLGGLDALAVDDRQARRRLLAGGPPDFLTERRMDP